MRVQIALELFLPEYVTQVIVLRLVVEMDIGIKAVAKFPVQLLPIHL